MSAGQDWSRDKRMRAITTRHKLLELAKAQSGEISLLREEVQRWRLRTYPTLSGQRSLI